MDEISHIDGLITGSTDREFCLPDAAGAYVSIYQHIKDNRLHWRISLLYVPANLRHCGIASRLLSKVTAQADAVGAVVNLSAEPKEKSIGLRDLKRFYNKFGFIQIPARVCGWEHYMERQPQNAGKVTE